VKFLLRFWKQVLYLFITGSTSIFIAACYGMPAGFQGHQSWKITVQDQNNEPIQGLVVSVIEYTNSSNEADTNLIDPTDSTGSTFYLYGAYEIESLSRVALIEDQDGESNGGAFADTLVLRNDENETIVKMRLLGE